LKKRRRIGLRQLIHDQKAERGLEEIVAEGGEELAQEQRQESPRRQQGKHGPLGVGVLPGPAPGALVSSVDGGRAICDAAWQLFNFVNGTNALCRN
jgi:hypothetical protein